MKIRILFYAFICSTGLISSPAFAATTATLDGKIEFYCDYGGENISDELPLYRCTSTEIDDYGSTYITENLQIAECTTVLPKTMPLGNYSDGSIQMVHLNALPLSKGRLKIGNLWVMRKLSPVTSTGIAGVGGAMIPESNQLSREKTEAYISVMGPGTGNCDFIITRINRKINSVPPLPVPIE